MSKLFVDWEDSRLEPFVNSREIEGCQGGFLVGFWNLVSADGMKKDEVAARRSFAPCAYRKVHPELMVPPRR